MSLSDQDKADLRKLDAAGTKLAITQQIARVHHATQDGTLDRATVADALDRLTVLTKVDEPDAPAKPDTPPKMGIFSAPPAPTQPQVSTTQPVASGG